MVPIRSVCLAAAISSGAQTTAKKVRPLPATSTYLDGLIITGVGADTMIIDANGVTDRVFHILAGTVTISGTTTQNGAVRVDGGGIYDAAALTLNDVVLTDNAADNFGGALYNANNTAVIGADGLYNAGSATISNSTFSDHVADGLTNVGALNLDSVTVADSISSGGVLQVRNSTIVYCSGAIESQGHKLIQQAAGCAIPGGSAILLQSALPVITQPVTIDGATQPEGSVTLSPDDPESPWKTWRRLSSRRKKGKSSSIRSP